MLKPLKVKTHQRHVKRTPSASQIRRRKAFMSCTYYWNNNLTTAQRQQWNSEAPGKLTGYNYFLSINLVRGYNELTALATPPRDY